MLKIGIITQKEIADIRKSARKLMPDVVFAYVAEPCKRVVLLEKITPDDAVNYNGITILDSNMEAKCPLAYIDRVIYSDARHALIRVIRDVIYEFAV